MAPRGNVWKSRGARGQRSRENDSGLCSREFDGERWLMTSKVMHAVDVKHMGEQHVTVEWESSGENDMIADATVGLLAGVDKSAASVKYCSRDGMTSHAHVHADARVGPWQQKMAWFLEAHFGAVGLHSEPNHDPVLVVRVDGEEARVDLMSSVSGYG